MTFAIEDRVALYKMHKDFYDRLEAMTPEEILSEHELDLALKKAKLDETKTRLEALGVKFDAPES